MLELTLTVSSENELTEDEAIQAANQWIGTNMQKDWKNPEAIPVDENEMVVSFWKTLY